MAGLVRRAAREPARGPVGAQPRQARARRPPSRSSTTTWAGSPTRASRNHVQPIPDSDVQFAKQWGMNIEIHDLRKVVRRGQASKGRHVVVGGHSLGGSITTAYATWDFNGKPGVKDLVGPRVHRRRHPPDAGDRGGCASSRSTTSTAARPWLAFGGIPAPFAGLFGDGGSLGGQDRAERAVARPGLVRVLPSQPQAAAFRRPTRRSSGYASDVKTSPPTPGRVPGRTPATSQRAATATRAAGSAAARSRRSSATRR